MEQYNNIIIYRTKSFKILRARIKNLISITIDMHQRVPHKRKSKYLSILLCKCQRKKIAILCHFQIKRNHHQNRNQFGNRAETKCTWHAIISHVQMRILVDNSSLRRLGHNGMEWSWREMRDR